MRFSPGTGLDGAGKMDGGADPPAGLCRDHPGEGKAVYSLLLRERTYQQTFKMHLNAGGIRIGFSPKSGFSANVESAIFGKDYI